MEQIGSLCQPGGLVFATERGTFINPFNLRNCFFKPLLKRVRLPPIRFHDLRYTCATWILSRKVNAKIVSEMLGCSSITLDTYSRVLLAMQESVVRTLEDALK